MRQELKFKPTKYLVVEPQVAIAFNAPVEHQTLVQRLIVVPLVDTEQLHHVDRSVHSLPCRHEDCDLVERRQSKRTLRYHWELNIARWASKLRHYAPPAMSTTLPVIHIGPVRML